MLRSIGLTFLSQYGWYILILAVVLFYIWNKYGSNYYNWRKKREEWLDEQNFGMSYPNISVIICCYY